ncbi:tyrosine-type recombinase/integrase [Streptosporangium vulgare]|uniref:Tyrosine-type recombinase/integrase n=1 Tax=Streptosporangium vulgare TaxID=46190 RepID=A0ABV5TGT9_9ACTN
MIIGDLRVQELVHHSGRVSFTILAADGSVCGLPDGFLRGLSGGTDRTYAYLLVDHLRWLESEGLTVEAVSMQDLERYMGAVGAEFRGPFGNPWRVGKKPYAQSSLDGAAACLKGFYVYAGSQGVNPGLAEEFSQRGARLPTKADRKRLFLGHVVQQVAANPLRPARVVRRRHPKMPPEGARSVLLSGLESARDRMTVTWLADGGFRIGEFCGLHLVDLHLREGAACGQCASPHVHICHRELNRNRSRAKSKPPWAVRNGVVTGGLVRRASPAMIHTYFEYMTTEYPRDAGHGMLLVQLHGARKGEPWAAAAARGMLNRAGNRLGLGKINPHSWRHQFATNVLDASDGNTVIARDTGGWASAVTVDETYGHADVHDRKFVAALDRAWEM